jgi:hypothetical protein
MVLLVYLKNHMLKMEPVNRHYSEQVVKELESIYSQCLKDPTYCTEKTTIIRQRTGTDLSELVNIKTSPPMAQTPFRKGPNSVDRKTSSNDEPTERLSPRHSMSTSMGTVEESNLEESAANIPIPHVEHRAPQSEHTRATRPSTARTYSAASMPEIGESMRERDVESNPHATEPFELRPSETQSTARPALNLRDESDSGIQGEITLNGNPAVPNVALALPDKMVANPAPTYIAHSKKDTFWQRASSSVRTFPKRVSRKVFRCS